MSVRIGLDVGGVIIDRIRNDGTDTSFKSDNFLLTSAVPGVFAAVELMTRAYGAENVFIISKAKPKTQDKTLRWFEHKEFYATTGFLHSNVYFCLERDEKGRIADCLPDGPLTHYVDDRADVLHHMPNVGTRYLFGEQDRTWLVKTEDFVPALTWPVVLRHLGLIA